MKGHVLIVDDNINNLRIAVDILIHEKLRITTAKCGADALKALDRNNIDLILLDINMPDMDGFETLKKIHQKENYSHAPVLFVTSHADEDFIERGFQSGCVDFITKPFRPAEFIARINTQLSLARHQNSLQEIVSEKTELLQSTIEELKASKAAKENFLSIMSHELRTPLNGILGMTELLKLPEMHDRQPEIIADLESSTKRLTRLITDILDFSTIDTPKKSLHASSVNITDFTTQIEYLASCREEFDVRFFISTSEEVPKELKIDEKSLLKVVECIVDNAIKFTSEGSVNVDLTYKQYGHNQGNLCIIVKDDGPGIPEEYIGKIFEKFFQIDSGLDRRYEGSGIGLAIAQKLALAMNGKISVDSQLNEGTTITVEIPVIQPNTEEAKIKTKHISEANLLIVEDVPTNQAFLSRLLSLKNSNIFIASDHKECFEIMDKEEIDLIFMDYMLPEMDGTEITKNLRQTYSSEQLPIIAVTAKAGEASRQECIESGMDSFLSKPYSAAEIFAGLSHYFNMD